MYHTINIKAREQSTSKVANKIDTYRGGVPINLVGDGFRRRLPTAVIKLEIERQGEKCSSQKISTSGAAKIAVL